METANEEEMKNVMMQIRRTQMAVMIIVSLNAETMSAKVLKNVMALMV